MWTNAEHVPKNTTENTKNRKKWENPANVVKMLNISLIEVAVNSLHEKTEDRAGERGGRERLLPCPGSQRPEPSSYEDSPPRGTKGFVPV